MPKKFKLLNPESIKYYKFTKPKKGEHNWSNSLYSRVGTQGDWKDEGGYSMKGTLLKLGYGQESADKQSMTWRDTRLAKLNNDYVSVESLKNKGGCAIGRKEEEKGGCKIGKKKKKLILRKKDPIPTDNRQGLELMKIPYIGGGVQARPEQLLGQMDLSLFGMKDNQRTAREILEPTRDIEQEEADDYLDEGYEQLIGMDDYENYDEEGEGYHGGGHLSDLLRASMNVERVLKREPRTIAYGDKDDFDIEQNQERYADVMKEFREEVSDEDEYPEDHDWDLEHTFDKVFQTGRKDEDFKNLKGKMDKFKDDILSKNIDFADFYKGEIEKHGKLISRAWEREIGDHQITPFKVVEDIRMDLGHAWGYQPDPDEDIVFYDEESVDEYFSSWKSIFTEFKGNFDEQMKERKFSKYFAETYRGDYGELEEID